MTPTFTLADGRTLAWAEYGDPAGTPLLLLHGTPGSRLQVAEMHDAALAAKVRVLAPDRPGCGRSDPLPDLTFRSYADDLQQLLDHQHLDEVVLAGVSGGGGFAAAAAAALGARVRLLVLACAMLPTPGNVQQGMSRQVRTAFLLAQRVPWLAGRALTATVAAPHSARAVRMRRTLPPLDRQIATDRAGAMAADGKEALVQGPAAAVRELALYRGALGIDLTQLTTQTVILHGEQDTSVPLSIARWAASQLPHARLEVVPQAGHLFLLERPELLLTLIS